jgi:hypothetical protein
MIFDYDRAAIRFLPWSVKPPSPWISMTKPNYLNSAVWLNLAKRHNQGEIVR